MGDELYCICRKPNDDMPMIMCNYCKEWYHFTCIKLDPSKSKSIKRYKCPSCKKKQKEEKERKQREALALLQLQSITKPKKPCHVKGCKNSARANSKYCKESCSMEATRIILRNIELLHRIRENTSRRNEIDDFSLQMIKHVQKTNPELLAKHQITQIVPGKWDSINSMDILLTNCQIDELLFEISEIRKLREKLKQCDETIPEIQKRKESLEDFIEQIESLDFEPKSVFDKEKRGMDIVDCPACGKPFVVKRYAKHIDQCLNKLKNNENYMVPRMTIDDSHTVILCNHFDPRKGSYCGRLKSSCNFHQEHIKKARSLTKVSLCGCPLSNADFSNFCKNSRKECLKHSGWEKIKLADLVQQIATQELQKQWHNQEIQSLEISLLKKKLSMNS